MAPLAGQRGRLRLPLRLVHALGGARAHDGAREVARRVRFAASARTCSTREGIDSGPHRSRQLDLPRYLAWRSADWRDPNTRSSARSPTAWSRTTRWNAEIDTALGLFVADGDMPSSPPSSTRNGGRHREYAPSMSARAPPARPGTAAGPAAALSHRASGPSASAPTRAGFPASCSLLPSLLAHGGLSCTASSAGTSGSRSPVGAA